MVQLRCLLSAQTAASQVAAHTCYTCRYAIEMGGIVKGHFEGLVSWDGRQLLNTTAELATYTSGSVTGGCQAEAVLSGSQPVITSPL